MFEFTPASFEVRHKGIYYKAVAAPREVVRADRQLVRQENKVKAAFFKYVDAATSEEVLNQVGEMYKRGDLVGMMRLTLPQLRDFASIIREVYLSTAQEEMKHLLNVFNIEIVRKVKITADVDVTFDLGDPLAAAYMKDAELDLIREVTKTHRTVIREAMADALNRGIGHVEASRLFKETLPLTKFQENAVRKYRKLLERNSREALTRGLRDRRSDRSVQRALRTGEPLSSSQIDSMTERYRRNMVSMRAETIARTEGGAAVSAARHRATRQMLKKAGIDEKDVIRIWHTRIDGRERKSHNAMNNQRRGMKEKFKTPGGIKLRYPRDRKAPAKEVINCRCVLETKFKETPPAVPPPPVSTTLTRPEVGGARASFLSGIAEMEATSLYSEAATTIELSPVSLRGTPEYTQLIKDAFKGANDVVRRLVNASWDSRYVADTTGYYRPIYREIHMPGSAVEVAQSEKLKTVFRHEYGHYVDDAMEEWYEMGTGKNRTLMTNSSSKEARALTKQSETYEATAAKLDREPISTDEWYIKKAMSEHNITRAELGSVTDSNSLISRYKRAYIRRFESQTAIDLDAMELSYSSKQDFVKALETGDVSKLVSILKFDKSFIGPSIIDFIGSVTRLRWGYGHSIEYYKKFSTIPIKRTSYATGFNYSITGGHVSEAYANWFSLYSMNAGMRNLLELLAPEVNKAFLKLTKRLSKIKQPTGH